MPKTRMNIAVLYSLFAVFSTAMNISFQMLSIWLCSGLYAVEVSILVGIAVGLPLRYLLSKRYIFVFNCSDFAHDGRLFVLYNFMSVFTTAIFWGVEYAYHLIFGTYMIRYVGGVMGLAMGFYVKYQLDKKYVFVSSEKKVDI